MKKMQKNNLFRAQSRKGFTLVELIVAVSIFLLVIVAAAGVVVQSIRVAATNKHNLQAAALAQQALNLTRTIRDTNLLSNNPAFQSFPAAGPSPYKIDLSDKAHPKLTGGPEIKTLNKVDYTVEITVDN